MSVIISVSQATFVFERTYFREVFSIYTGVRAKYFSTLSSCCKILQHCHQVCELMFVESRSVSHTAAEFATRYLFSDDFMTRARGAKVPKGTSVLTECVVCAYVICL